MRALLFVLLLAPCSADEVRFTNGDRLSGQLVHLVDGRLRLRSQVAGQVDLKIAAVAAIRTEQPLPVELKDGTSLTGVLTPTEDGRLELVAGDARRAVTMADLAAINPPEPLEAGGRWRGQITTGLNSHRGNSAKDDINLALNLVREDRTDKLTLSSSYRLDREQSSTATASVTVQDAWSAGLRYDYSFSSRFFTFLDFKGKGDRAKNLNSRLIASFGAGYHLPRSRQLNFQTDWGLSWLSEDYTKDRGRKEELTAQVSYGVDRRFAERFMILHGLKWYPSLEAPKDFLLTSDGGLRYYFTERIFVGLDATLDYDSTPAPDSKAINVKYGAGFGLSF